jgi:hypothetical protein
MPRLATNHKRTTSAAANARTGIIRLIAEGRRGGGCGWDGVWDGVAAEPLVATGAGGVWVIVVTVQGGGLRCSGSKGAFADAGRRDRGVPEASVPSPGIGVFAVASAFAPERSACAPVRNGEKLRSGDLTFAPHALVKSTAARIAQTSGEMLEDRTPPKQQARCRPSRHFDLVH